MQAVSRSIQQEMARLNAVASTAKVEARKAKAQAAQAESEVQQLVTLVRFMFQKKVQVVSAPD